MYLKNDYTKLVITEIMYNPLSSPNLEFIEYVFVFVSVLLFHFLKFGVLRVCIFWCMYVCVCVYICVRVSQKKNPTTPTITRKNNNQTNKQIYIHKSCLPSCPRAHTHTHKCHGGDRPVADPSSIDTAVAVAAHSPAVAVAAQTPAAAAGAAKRAAKERIRASALQLAREIRKPRSYIGYVAFVLFALLKKTRLQMWEGANKFCVIELFAPWAKDMCTKECAYAAIPCALNKSTKVS